MPSNDFPSTPTLGTTPQIRLPKEQAGLPIKPGQGYFRVRLHAAQAAIFGPFWQKAEQLAVTSEVRLYCPPFEGTPLQSLQRIRPLRQGAPEQLGLSPNLVDLVPASFEKLSIAIEFLLDRRNRLVDLAKLANDDAFISVISLAPGAAAVAKAITMLTRKILTAFMDENDQQPVLKFSGDFSLPAGDLADAYYVILGSRYDQYPLPRPLPGPPRLQVQGRDLVYDGQPVLGWSYVILDVDTVEARTKDLGRGEPWYACLDEVDVLANQMKNNPFVTMKSRKETWGKCLNLIKDADALLRVAPMYLPVEAQAIIQQAYLETYEKIFQVQRNVFEMLPELIDFGGENFLKVASEDDLKGQVSTYRKQQANSRLKLKQMGLL